MNQVLIPPSLESKTCNVGSPTLAVEMYRSLRKTCTSSAVNPPRTPAARSTLRADQNLWNLSSETSSNGYEEWQQKSLFCAVNAQQLVLFCGYIYMTSKLNGIRTATEFSTMCNSCHIPQHSFGLGQVALDWAISGTVWEQAPFRDHS